MNSRLRDREIFGHSRSFERDSRGDVDVERLGVARQLEGHQGCVNCLQWNTAGTLLASGSDDQHVFLWGIDGRKRHSFRTGHTNNIFSVQFLPASSSDVLLSGAGDHTVRLHTIGGGGEPHCWRHSGRVKRIAVTPGDPFLAWSAVENGHIIQYDVRSLESFPLLTFPDAECKSLAVNPCRSEMLAVACDDPKVRIYDRRFMQIPLLCLIPAHIPITEHLRRSQYRKLSVTHVAFTAGGDQLLSNIGGEQIYLFDVLRNSDNDANTELQRIFPMQEEEQDESEPGHSRVRNGFKSRASDAATSTSEFSPVKRKRHCANQAKIDAERELAKGHFNGKRYTQAIDIYSELIAKSPGKSSILLSNRAQALIFRKWDGDAYEALKNAITALNQDPNNSKAHFRIVTSLVTLNQLQLARRAQQEFQRFANEKDNAKLERLLKAAAGSDEPEKEWQIVGRDFASRFCGHCNTSTDIKEATFFGGRDEYIVAGSDCGSLFIWQRDSMRLRAAFHADEHILNCVQPHPSLPLIATSGIEHHICLWQPHSEQDEQWENERRVSDVHALASSNQKRMHTNHLELMLRDAGFQFQFDRMEGHFDRDGGDGDDGEGDHRRAVQCLQS